MTIITPTNGRIVWFHPCQHDPLYRLSEIYGRRPFAAMICFVWDDHTVNLDVVDPEGDHHAITSVHLVQPKEPPDSFIGRNFCEWIPYQIGQAARTEEAEKKAVKNAAENT